MTTAQPHHALPGTRARRRIYLMRHGEVNYRQPDGKTVFGDFDLSDEGAQQARLAGRFLSDVQFDLAVHTGLRRTRQTAELALAGRAVELREYKRLRELKGGNLAGLNAAQIESEFVYGTERAHHPDAAFPGGERYADFQVRIVPAFEQLVVEPGWRTLLVVAHAGTNGMILSWVTRGGLAGVAALEQDAACINIIDVDVIDGRIARRFLRAFNMTPYNLAKAGHYLTVAERIAWPDGKHPAPPAEDVAPRG